LIELGDKVNTRVIVVIVGLVLIAVGAYFIFSEPEPVEEVASAPVIRTQPPELEPTLEAVVQEPVEPVEPIGEVIEPPVDSKIAPPTSLDNSDVKVMLAIADISSDLAKWLVPEEQIRKWVLFTDNAANGDLIHQHRPWKYSMKSLAVANIGDKKYLAPSNYKRAKPLLDTVMAVPPARLAEYYRSWSPLLEKAYRELGKKGSFDARLKQAIDNVLAVNNLPAEPELKLPSVMYQYQQPTLEASSDIEKLMWRLGFENTNDLQRYLGELKARL
jgi:hypothetical protein